MIKSLKNKKEIDNLFATGRMVRNSLFTFKFLKNTLNYPRYVLGVSKKFFKTAVLRNKIKRQVREMLRIGLKDKSFDVFVLVNNNYDTKTYKENENEFLNLTNEIK